MDFTLLASIIKNLDLKSLLSFFVATKDKNISDFEERLRNDREEISKLRASYQELQVLLNDITEKYSNTQKESSTELIKSFNEFSRQMNRCKESLSSCRASLKIINERCDILVVKIQEIQNEMESKQNITKDTENKTTLNDDQ